MPVGGSEGAVRELLWRSVLLVACALCGHWHALDWSPWCPMCWGGICGEVPGDRADDGEVCDGC